MPKVGVSARDTPWAWSGCAPAAGVDPKIGAIGFAPACVSVVEDVGRDPDAEFVATPDEPKVGPFVLFVSEGF